MAVNNLIFTRIDDRLIHGQVCTSWIKTLDVEHILVCDDKTSEDSFMEDMFKMLIPEGITIDILNTNDAAVKLKGGLDKKTMMIVKFPKTIKDLVDAGVGIEEVNVGGMGMTEGRSKFYKNISASEEEKTIFKELTNKNIKVEIQIIPAEKKFDVSELL